MGMQKANSHKSGKNGLKMFVVVVAVVVVQLLLFSVEIYTDKQCCIKILCFRKFASMMFRSME